jgi:hypothetical protein
MVNGPLSKDPIGLLNLMLIIGSVNALAEKEKKFSIAVYYGVSANLVGVWDLPKDVTDHSITEVSITHGVP